VAERLVAAQQFLRAHGFGLKIWDAYRPARAQHLLWELAQNGSYVADPKGTVGSMHTRGVAVDATLVDRDGRDVAMPTDFDSFTPAAMLVYQGNDANVRTNLNMLQRAMARSGFYGLRTEWWHFCAEDWWKFDPIQNAQ
jgi:D-alanyl-D-alanine dipeptidase